MKKFNLAFLILLIVLTMIILTILKSYGVDHTIRLLIVFILNFLFITLYNMGVE